jgi:hypothetical protein
VLSWSPHSAGQILVSILDPEVSGFPAQLIRASGLSKEILTNPEFGLTVAGVPDWTAK